MMTSEQVAKQLNTTRASLRYNCLRLGLKPRQRIVNGRTHNFYSAAQAEQIRAVLRVNFKDRPPVAVRTTPAGKEK